MHNLGLHINKDAAAQINCRDDDKILKQIKYIRLV